MFTAVFTMSNLMPGILTGIKSERSVANNFIIQLPCKLIDEDI